MDKDLILVTKTETIQTDKGPTEMKHRDLFARIGVSDTLYVATDGTIFLRNGEKFAPIDMFYRGADSTSKNSSFCKGNGNLIESKIEKIYKQSREDYKNITETKQ
jgi:hypothetical protein